MSVSAFRQPAPTVDDTFGGEPPNVAAHQGGSLDSRRYRFPYLSTTEVERSRRQLNHVDEC
jgi:hypothetical protein